jgi:hypothetical protein
VEASRKWSRRWPYYRLSRADNTTAGEGGATTSSMRAEAAGGAR